jgi:Tol biopolymer transport system component
VPTSTSRPTTTATNIPHPPCGRQIAFESQQQGVDAIALVDVCSQKVSWLTDTAQRTVDPRWSPDGRHLAFLRKPVSRDGEIFSNLWLLDVATYEFLQITPHPNMMFSENSIVWAHVWSPDGEEILFVSEGEDSLRSVILHLDDHKSQVLPEGLKSPFSWSPDGTKIALRLESATPDDESMILYSDLLAVIHPDGHWAEESHLFLQSVYDWHWSPDSQLLALVASPEGMRGIGDIQLYEIEGDDWILKARLKDVLPSDEMEDYGVLSFDWSPTGEEMAFALVSPDDLFVHWGQVQVANRDFTRIRTLTPEGMYCVDVQWSPDGSQLAFACEDGELTSLWIIDADGTDLQRITEPAKGTRDPQWRPLLQP